MKTRVLCVNLGSRTAKLTVVDVADDALAGSPPQPAFESDVPLDTLHTADIEQQLAACGVDDIAVVAYRTVRIAALPPRDAVEIDDRVLAEIRASEEFAPLHTRSMLTAHEILAPRFPGARQMAVFDGAYHRSIPEHAAAYGLPYDDFVAGWKKMGFHGLSHGYAAARAAVLLGDAVPQRKLVSAHLGGGASIAAIAGDRSVDTTMGFTPIDGLLMATRSGSIDAGMLLAYMRRRALSIDETESLLSERSGLLGLGGSADMRELITARERGDRRATLAYDVFVYRTVTAIGAMCAALNGIEVLTFLGGIGENAPVVRTDVCASLAFAGVRLDPAANAAPSSDALISAADSTVRVLRIRTREDWTMALAAAGLSGGAG